MGIDGMDADGDVMLMIMGWIANGGGGKGGKKRDRGRAGIVYWRGGDVTVFWMHVM